MRIRDLKQALQSKFDRQFRKSKAKASNCSNIYLPIELWLEILSLLPSESIAAASLTCRSLRCIAQPALFRDLAIHPFLTSTEYRLLELAPYIDRCFRRLEFISSPRFAPHVRSFSLTPCPRGHSLSIISLHVPENDVVDRVFDILPYFKNLDELVLHSIKSTPERMKILGAMNLDYFQLEIRGYDITWKKKPQGDSQPAPIPARRVFYFNCNASPHQTPMPLHVDLQFQYPTTLEEIYSGPSGTESILLAMTSSPSRFENLRTLDISIRFVSSNFFVPALRQCPGLTLLRLQSAPTDSPIQPVMTAIPSDILPALSTYHGPPSLAARFTHGRSIRTLRLWSSNRATSVVKPNKLVDILSRLEESVEELEIGVTTLPPILIKRIAENFPNLKSLSVNGHLSSYQPGIAVTHLAQIQCTPSIVVGDPDAQLKLETFAFGAQVPTSVPIGSPEYKKSVLALLERFPKDYDPTSWDQWAIGLPWSKIIWKRLASEDSLSSGTLSVEHVEYERAVFRTYSSDAKARTNP